MNCEGMTGLDFILLIICMILANWKALDLINIYAPKVFAHIISLVEGE